MKRNKALQALSMEHHQSLLLAKKCRQMAVEQDKEKVKKFCSQLQQDFSAQWENHFLTEEKSIFAFANNKTAALKQLCEQLQQQHDTMRVWVKQINPENSELLQQFGVLLAEHTRLEERGLFPLVEAEFTQQELDYIAKTSAQYATGAKTCPSRYD